jgi:peroxiredoxin Q/BCP
VVYFMASVDSAEDNRGFAEKNEASFPILSDPSKATSEAYGVLSERGYARRWTFYIDGEGVIQKIDREVSPGTAGADLVANLEALEVPRAQ